MPNGLRLVVWKADDAWLGYLFEYPDFVTQGESLEDLAEHLEDLLAGILSGETV
jgi:predicted RNase H-like HicB family nuclease